MSINRSASMNNNNGSSSLYAEADVTKTTNAAPSTTTTTTTEEEEGLALLNNNNMITMAPGATAGSPYGTWRSAILTTVPVFMGYSGMVVLQEGLEHRLDIESKTHAAYIFGIGVGNLYLGNLIFRLFHNIIFTAFRPRQRVMISYICMITAFLLLLIPYYIFSLKTVAFVFIAYLVGGIGIGTFESNLVSCLTPLGHETKSWAVLGMPAGFNAISIGSFILSAAIPKKDENKLQAALYTLICCANVAGLLFYIFRIPNVQFEASKDTVHTFFKDLKLWREWLPIIWRHCLALCLDMCCVSVFASVVLYIYNVDPMPLWPESETTMPKNAFLAIYFTFSFLGDFTSRRIAYRVKEKNPFWFLILSVCGVGIVLSKTCLVAPFGMFLIMFANGSIYAHTTKFIDNHVPKRYNLMALSVWLFVGDVGSYVGAQVTQPLRTAIGVVPQHEGPPSAPSRHDRTVTRTIVQPPPKPIVVL